MRSLSFASRSCSTLFAACALLALAGCRHATSPLVPDVRMTAAVEEVSASGVTIRVVIRNVSLVKAYYFGFGPCAVPEVEFVDAAGHRVPWRDPSRTTIAMPCGPERLEGRETLDVRARFPATFFDPEGNPYPAAAGQYTAILRFRWWAPAEHIIPRAIDLNVPFDWSPSPSKL